MKRQTRKIPFRFILLPVITLLILTGVAIAILFSQQEHLVELAVKDLRLCDQ